MRITLQYPGHGAWDTMGHSWQAGGTHPTGMLSCWDIFWNVTTCARQKSFDIFRLHHGCKKCIQYVQIFLGKTEVTHIALQVFALQNTNERIIRRLLAVQNILADFGCYIACKKLLTRKQQWIGSKIGEITSLYPWSRLSPGGVKRVFRFLWHQTHI